MFFNRLIVLLAGLLPIVVYASGLYAWPTQGLAIVVANIGLTTATVLLYMTGLSDKVSQLLYYILGVLITISLLYHGAFTLSSIL